MCCDIREHWKSRDFSSDKNNNLTRMHSSRMRTCWTLTVFPKNWRPPRKLETTPPKNWRPPQKIGDPPEKLEDPPGPDPTPPKKKIGDPPKTIGGPPPPDQTPQDWPARHAGIPPPLWTEWMTDRCKNITLAKTSFRPVKINQRLFNCHR